MKFGDLPSELVDLVFSHLVREKRTLQALSLTCSAFAPVARFYLFTVINFWGLAEPFMGSFLTIVREVKIRSRAHSLSWWCGPASSKAFECLLHLPNLTSLILIGLTMTVDWQRLQASFSSPLSRKNTCFSRLRLENVSLPHPAELPGLLALFNNIEILELYGTNATIPDLSMSPVLYMDPPKLTKFVVGGNRNISESVAWKMSSWLSSTQTVEELVVGPGTICPWGVLGAFGKSIRHLALSLENMDREWAVCYNRTMLTLPNRGGLGPALLGGVHPSGRAHGVHAHVLGFGRRMVPLATVSQAWNPFPTASKHTRRPRWR